MKNRGRGSKAKGAAFERQICQALSLWITADKKTDCFWRSAMSGGRATVGRKRGRDHSRQAGDICAIAPEGHRLTDKYYIECKFYRDLNFGAFLFGAGPLAAFWRKTVEEAGHYSRDPLLIARQNRGPIVLLSAHAFGDYATTPSIPPIAIIYADNLIHPVAHIYLFSAIMHGECSIEEGSKS